MSELDNALGEAKIIKDELVVSGLDVLQDRLETPLSPEGRRDQPGLAHGHQTGHPGYPAASVVHSHWSSSDITALSLVESLIVMRRKLSYAIKAQLKAPKDLFFLPYAGSSWHKDR